MNQRIAVVTGASTGIGAATARALAGDGYEVVCVARRTDRIQKLADEIGGRAITCDITSAEDVAALAASLERVDVLVNNAGGAIGTEPIETAVPADWARMYEINVLGLMRVTQALLPAVRASDAGLILNVGSTAGRRTYEGGAGYTAAKHGTKVVTETLRMELIGEPIRVTEIAPGMVHTEEFNITRMRGDRTAAAALYDGIDSPLVAEDIAETIRWVASLPRHVNIDELVVRPVAQRAQHRLHKGPIFR